MGGAAQGIVGDLATKYLGEEGGQIANAGANFLGDKMANMVNGQPAAQPTAEQPQAPGAPASNELVPAEDHNVISDHGNEIEHNGHQIVINGKNGESGGKNVVIMM